MVIVEISGCTKVHFCAWGARSGVDYVSEAPTLKFHLQIWSGGTSLLTYLKILKGAWCLSFSDSSTATLEKIEPQDYFNIKRAVCLIIGTNGTAGYKEAFHCKQVDAARQKACTTRRCSRIYSY